MAPINPLGAIINSAMNLRSLSLAIAALVLLSIPTHDCHAQLDPDEIARFAGDEEPFFEIWDEEVVYGVLDVAKDGTVLMFSLQGDPHPDKRQGSKIFLKRSENGGATWSDHQLLGGRTDLDVEALGIGPYDRFAESYRARAQQAKDTQREYEKRKGYRF